MNRENLQKLASPLPVSEAPDADGWIAWPGGERPVPADMLVDAVVCEIFNADPLADLTTYAKRAADLNWSGGPLPGKPNDDGWVVAFRPSQPASQEAEGPSEERRLRHALERDRSKVAEGINAIEAVLAGRQWLCEGRGPYAWDDDRYQQEFAGAIDDIHAALKPLKAVAADWTDCPTDPAEIKEARRSPSISQQVEPGEAQRGAWRFDMEAAPHTEVVEVVARYVNATAGFPMYVSWRDDLGPRGWYQHTKHEPLRVIAWAWRPRTRWPQEPHPDDISRAALSRGEEG